MRFLPTIQLKVELFAGTGIADAAEDLVELANRVGTLCEAKFNGVHLWARPGDDPARLVAAWVEQMKLPSAVYKIAQARNAPVVTVEQCTRCNRQVDRACMTNSEAAECRTLGVKEDQRG